MQATTQNLLRIGDITIVGYFVSIDLGSIAKHVAIGFGSGAADLEAVVEAYLMSLQGLRWLGSGELTPKGSRVLAKPCP